MTSFVLKLIAAVSMLADHTGLLLFPGKEIFRAVGRLAFPLYAFCIAEGFRYTRSRLNYFLRVFVLGVLCQIVYTIADGELYLGILITFSLSLVIMTLVDALKASLRGEESSVSRLLGRISGKALSPAADRALCTALACASILGAFLLTTRVTVDYGFFGIMLPVCTSLFEERGQRLVMFSACLLALCIELTWDFPVQYWSLLAVPLAAAYNGRPGRIRMKYFFYIFYPAHLAILYGISLLR